MPKAPLLRFFPVALFLLALSLPSGIQADFTLRILHRGDNGAFAAADLDGDGRRDIVVARKPQALQWMTYPALQPQPIATGGNIWMEIHAGDADGDGDADILAPDMAASELCWWENPGHAALRGRTTPWTRHRMADWDGAFAHDFKVGDLNADGRLDAVLRTKNSRVFQVLIQDRPRSWSTRRLDLAFGPGEGTALGDLDGDGDLDLTDGLVWLETPRDPLRDPWPRHAFNAGYGCSLTRVAIADMNLDGRNDIVVSTSDTSLNLPVVWFEAVDPQEGFWRRHAVMPASRANWLHTLQVGDINRDGYPDVLTGSDHRGSKEMLIYLNADRGRGDSWTELAWPTAYGVWQAVLADVSRDGRLDILTSDDANDSQQELWINNGSLPGNLARPQGKDGKAWGSGKPRHGLIADRMLFFRGDNGYDAGGRLAW